MQGSDEISYKANAHFVYNPDTPPVIENGPVYGHDNPNGFMVYVKTNDDSRLNGDVQTSTFTLSDGTKGERESLIVKAGTIPGPYDGVDTYTYVYRFSKHGKTVEARWGVVNKPGTGFDTKQFKIAEEVVRSLQIK